MSPPAYLHMTGEAFHSINSDLIEFPSIELSTLPLILKAEDHLVVDGMLKGYDTWIFHGEAVPSACVMADSDHRVHDEPILQDEMHEMLHDLNPLFNPAMDNVPSDGGVDLGNTSTEGPDLNSQRFFKLLEDVEQKLYPGSKFTKLSFLVRLFHIKCLNGWSNKSFTMLLDLLKEALPDGETLPKSFYETKKIIKDLGLDYNKIDACPNDCMLYWKEAANEFKCRTCGASRWRTDAVHPDDEPSETSTKGKKIPAKILCHFPLKPRLQRLYMSRKTTSFMTWHDEGRTKDGILRHPADSTAWKTLDCKYKEFGSETRNVRLGLASDGFNPFRTMSIAHSTWPVVLMSYNLPPWMCMKQPYMILSLLIPGPSSPGNDIDIYLKPLVEELKELWIDGVQTFDAARNEMFQMHAAVLWTISDFPAYANLSGWSTKGKLACPSCHKETCSQRLTHGRKQCYMGHRQFLPINHTFRSDKSGFDGTEERRVAPILLSGSQVLDQLQSINVTFGKKPDTSGKKLDTRGKKQDTRGKKSDNSGKKPNTHGKKRRHKKNPNEPEENTEEKPHKEHNWKKKSIFFCLPYWESLLLRHNLDVMHIEKNVCDNVIGTLLNIEGKTKDSVKARLDLKKMNIRRTLHPITKGNNKTYVPPACFTMSSKEKDIFCGVLKHVKVPNGYSSNISQRVYMKQRKISGLKSHDCHVLMQQLLPLALRSSLPKTVSSVLIELCSFFRELCSKVLKSGELMKLKNRVALTLCHMEKIFPPAFFDVMVHLPIHLADEARLAGPVQYRWMYPIERYLLTLKSYVRNRNRVGGSIAEGYLAEECLTFCARYLEGVESKLNRPQRNDEDAPCEFEEGFAIFSVSGRALGKIHMEPIDPQTVKQAHRYVLFNCAAVNQYLEKHIAELWSERPRALPRDIDHTHNERFPDWFKKHVEKLHESNEQISEKLRWLSGGPSNIVRRYTGYIVNGIRYNTKDREQGKRTQNSGVVVIAKTNSFASARDRNPTAGDVSYYGVLTFIIELNYYEQLKALLFKCDWFDITPNRGIRKDEFGFTVVNTARRLSSDEPFILASQAQQSEVVEIQNLEEIEQWERTDIVGTEIDIPLDVFSQENQDEEEYDTEQDDSDGVDNTSVELDGGDSE
ncbi:uncharacterized protein LOC143875914 [Tasmannia lanceolata]|uniref:uncharacterized protein LOC143875914 n=1 Tax=Tasmannia lanceolata TaxID=3420 RepID=UPI0040627C53